MGIKIAMFICASLIPLVMLVFGIIFRKAAPKNINILFGYRTERSMKNADTWRFAHKHIGRTWTIVGIPMLIVSVIAMALSMRASETVVTAVSTGLTIVQLVVFVTAIFPTERALERTFDKNGNRKDK